ncbi:hypothetical protein [Mycobacterium sp. UM_CSW]|uniref:hypothetical protein n=1 Tax=Mycobacterium sp. UM_CSW TaxID=1370119 RepID=UPI0003FC62C3|nr:hypothetical protein [Mycobacterium sp. UM_CSW]
MSQGITQRHACLIRIASQTGRRFENYFRELGELLVEHADDPLGKVLHELPEFGELADKYGLTYGNPDWMDDIARRYGLNSPSH